MKEGLLFVFDENKEKLDIAGKIFPFDLPVLIAHLIASFFLLFCIIFLLYKPFKKWMELRAQKENLLFKNLQQELATAKANKLLSQKKLQGTKKFIDKMLLESKNEVNQEKLIILKETQELRKEILAKTDFQVTKMKKEAQNEIQEAIVANAILLSEKILRQKLNKEEQQKIFDDFVKKLDD